MAHIAILSGHPGVSGLMDAYPETGEPLNAFADALMCGPSPSFVRLELARPFAAKFRQRRADFPD